MYLDHWRISSKPIDIPIVKKSKVLIGTPTSTYNATIIESSSSDLFKARLISTPPLAKHFKKGDLLMIHKDNILQKIESP